MKADSQMETAIIHRLIFTSIPHKTKLTPAPAETPFSLRAGEVSHAFLYALTASISRDI